MERMSKISGLDFAYFALYLVWWFLSRVHKTPENTGVRGRKGSDVCDNNSFLDQLNEGFISEILKWKNQCESTLKELFLSKKIMLAVNGRSQDSERLL